MKIGQILIGVLFIAIFTVLFGCSSLPTENDYSAEFTIEDYAAIFYDSYNPGYETSPHPIAVESGSGIVSSVFGGIVDVNLSNSTTRFVVPPKALGSNTEITITVREVTVQGKTILDFEFGPEGLVFDRDARILINKSAFQDIDMRYINWYYFNPETNEFELEHQIKVLNSVGRQLDDGYILIPVSHFSRYVGVSQGGQQ